MTALLTVDALARSFGGVQAVQNISFDVGENIVFALIGPNGAGKTTVINMLTGLLAPSAGKIRFRGADITGRPVHRTAAAGIARTYQNGRLFARLTVRENVLTGGHHRLGQGVLSGLLPTPRQRAAARDLADRADALLREFSLIDVADRPVGSLPYGRRRLVEITRALAGAPSLLLLDEPAAGLNSREANELADIFHRLKTSGTTVLLVEHNMGLVMRSADRIAVLNFGRKIAEGTPAEIRADRAVREAYLGHGHA